MKKTNRKAVCAVMACSLLASCLTGCGPGGPVSSGASSPGIEEPYSGGGSMYKPWWTAADLAAVEKGDKSSLLSRFDFVHAYGPKTQDLTKSFNPFYLGNGSLGMYVDPFGAQSLPFIIQDNKNAINLDGTDRTVGTYVSEQMDAEPYYFYCNTHPVINTVDNWTKNPTPQLQNSYGRGQLSLRMSVFPTVDGRFDPALVTEYNQTLTLWDNVCTTTYVYDGRVRVTMRTFVSWSDDRLAVFDLHAENIGGAEARVGFVAEPILAHHGERLDFTWQDGRLQWYQEENGDLLFSTAVDTGVKSTLTVEQNAGQYTADTALSPAQSADFTAYLTMLNTETADDPQAQARETVDRAAAAELQSLIADHTGEVHAYWNGWTVLFPWKDMAQYYYRNALVIAGNLRGGKYYPSVSTLAGSSYGGVGWGMDNIPLFDFLMQTGNAPYVKRVLEHFVESIPEENLVTGAQFDYCYDNDPTATNITNVAPNYAWLMYEYYQYTGDEDFLRDTAYPMLKAVSNFYVNYAREKGGFYGLWHNQEYNGQLWRVHSMEEHIYTLTGYNYAECDNPIDVLAPAKRVLLLASEVAGKLGVDGEMAASWQACSQRLMVPQNDRYYLVCQGESYTDPFPAREMSAAALTAVYPARMPGLDNAKMEATIKAHLNFKELGGSFLERHSYSFRLAPASIRMRMTDYAKWLLLQSVMKLENLTQNAAYDKMMITEGQGGGAGYFMMTYGDIANCVDDMLLQSYDGVLRVFPCMPEVFGDNEAEFRDLAAFGAFRVSAKMVANRTVSLSVRSEKGNTCRLELPQGWEAASVTGPGGAVEYETSEETARINEQDVTVKVLAFATHSGETYAVVEK